ncbi:diaminopimelate epimerase [Bordetella sp. BOR01]|uniref:diaminopimelate epimerase n=1 Tax=Bordetella sp. BOR01 TaxID=2854779 RepID=UPI001C4829C6|nr:diaminopimelate epimerase [Bordetella sp. BOR01]MBV7484637.1 diaminopimelate epimerase [Bordetella sp. BOR01]
MIDFTKMEGCGNDFIVVDGRSQRLDADLSGLGRRLCARTTGIGADGLIVLRAATDSDAAYAVDIINASGLPAEMCGNGARCVALYAIKHGIAPPQHHFATLAGRIGARLLDNGEVGITLTAPTGVALNQQVSAAGRSWALDYANTGVPHAVIWVDEPLDRVDVPGLGPALRHHPLFPHGTNVNFVARTADGLAIRTFERGVEAETQACGTGASAAALLAWLRGYASTQVRVHTRHGGVLSIAIEPVTASVPRLRLAGPAHAVFTGRIAAAGHGSAMAI